MMKRSVLAVVLALVALGIAGYAVGATATVMLTSTGPEPQSVSINWGDTVSYSNGDSIEHVVVIPRAEYTSPAIPPGGKLDYIFTGKSGTYSFVQQGGRNRSGQVRVSADGSVTIKASAAVVPFGKSVALSGRSTFPGSPVVLMGREGGAGGSSKAVLEVTAQADGSYTARLRPERGARYQARVAAGQIASDTVEVIVRPRVTIAVSRRTAPAGTKIVVTGRIAPAGAAANVDLAIYDPGRKRWVVIGTQRVKKDGKAVFRPTIEEGATRLRVVLRRGSTQAGFTTAESRIVRVVGLK
jgi:plastocyanin